MRFVQQDVFKTDLSQASVLTLYLLPAMMLNLRTKIFNELQARRARGIARLSSWRLAAGRRQISFDVPEKEAITGVPSGDCQSVVCAGQNRRHMGGQG